MAITESAIIEDSTQADGRRHVRERHIDHAGIAHWVVYMAESGANVSTILANRVAGLLERLKAAELASNLANALSDDTPAPTFVHCTKLEFGSVLREAYKVSKGRDTARLGWYVEGFRVSTPITDAQMRALFGITTPQLTTLKTKLVALSAKYEDIMDDTGE